MDALNASFDLLKSQLFQCPPPPFNAGSTYHSVCKEGGGEKGYNLKFLKTNRSKYLFLKKVSQIHNS